MKCTCITILFPKQLSQSKGSAMYVVLPCWTWAGFVLGTDILPFNFCLAVTRYVVKPVSNSLLTPPLPNISRIQELHHHLWLTSRLSEECRTVKIFINSILRSETFYAKFLEWKMNRSFFQLENCLSLNFDYFNTKLSIPQIATTPEDELKLTLDFPKSCIFVRAVVII